MTFPLAPTILALLFVALLLATFVGGVLDWFENDDDGKE